MNDALEEEDKEEQKQEREQNDVGRVTPDKSSPAPPLHGGPVANRHLSLTPLNQNMPVPPGSRNSISHLSRHREIHEQNTDNGRENNGREEECSE